MNHKHAHLDSLRWIAAFCVGMGHAFLAVNANPALFQVPRFFGTMVFNGTYAVVFFFVLSGFVLVNATAALNLRSYTGFEVRRFLRIYPAAWVSLMVAGGAVILVNTLPRFGPPWIANWLFELLQLPDLTLGSIVGELSLATHRTNPILWSIAIEMLASLLYPLMIFVMRKSIEAYFALCLCAMVASALIVSDLSLSTSGHYLYMFMIGAALNLLKPGFISTKLGGYLLVCAVVLVLLCRPFNYTVADFFYTLSAAVVISVVAFACPASLQKLLSNNRFLLLGRCSYSYYLLNPAVLLIVAYWYPFLGFGPPETRLQYTVYALVLGGVAAILTTPLANLMAISVERLSIKVGRKAERRITAPASTMAMAPSA